MSHDQHTEQPSEPLPAELMAWVADVLDYLEYAKEEFDARGARRVLATYPKHLPGVPPRD